MARTVDDYIVDFKDEESGGGGGSVRVKPGTYKVRIVNVKAVKSENKGTVGLEVTFAFLEGKLRKQKKKIKDTLWKAPKAYIRFRSLLEAVDEDVPSKLDLRKIGDDLKGKNLYVEIDDEPGREGYGPRSRVQFDGFINEDDYDPDEAEDDEDDEEDELEEEDEDIDEEDEEEDEEDEEDEEEEEPAPKKRRKRAPAKKAPAKSKAKKKKAADDDEDEEITDLDLDDY